MIRTRHFLIVIPLIVISCNNKKEKVRPVQETITESVYASGVIKSNNQYKVFSTVNGVIDTILVKEGDLVKKGDPIIKLVNTSAQLNTNNAALSADYNAANNNAEKLGELQVSINLARSKMEEDGVLLQRQQNLWNQNIGSRNELEQRQLAYKNSVTAYETAKFRYAQLQKQISFQEKQSQNNLSIASTIKGDYIIRAGLDGRVYSIAMKQGEMVNVSMPVAVIGDAADFMLELQVDEFDINRVKTGQLIAVSMDSYKGQVFEARVTSIDPIMNEKSKSFTIEAVFSKPPPVLYPNLTCEANIVIQQKEKAITIPRSYLLPGDSVWIGPDQKRKVTTGLKDYQKVEVINGITVNDLIYKPAL